ncbi:GntR family transcriptional regulator [Halomonas cupida]|uniref:DNA-binding transcriptional regulator, GntR family n=1 Tax=Halomonas cupida TaxID=44933 RepID=A0A1M7MS46_9GAMM|nr:GntR family transcriptional regulator [Halomonas cupida]GEN26010.1 GntR family transcriptional regulator [Halomonas cupida]SHM93868.1 DNA-binding transcriptional regulator, GntR family [Halomonas cupida]
MTHNFSEKAYNTLWERIVSGELRASAPIDIPRIANELEMSVAPVRNAIKRLEADGLVAVIPRSGTYVRDFTIQDLIYGYELVEALDGMAGYLVAERVAANDIDGLELEVRLTSLVDEMEQNLAREHVRQWAELDARFHQIIFDMADNALIANSYHSVRSRMKLVLSFISPIHVDRENSVREHRLIISAITSGNREEARRLCQNHRSLVRQILKSLLA